MPEPYRIFIAALLALGAVGYALYRHPPFASVARGELGVRANRLPFRSIEGLPLGVDVSVRYALDPARLRALWLALPDDIDADIVQPAVASVVCKVLARYTVREIFSSKRAEIQAAIEGELRGKLARDGVALRDVLIGNVDLPPDYRQVMHALLAEELVAEPRR